MLFIWFQIIDYRHKYYGSPEFVKINASKRKEEVQTTGKSIRKGRSAMSMKSFPTQTGKVGMVDLNEAANLCQKARSIKCRLSRI